MAGYFENKVNARSDTRPRSTGAIPKRWDQHVFIKIAGTSRKHFRHSPLRRSFYNKVRYEDIGYGIFWHPVRDVLYNLFIYLTLNQTNFLLYICTIVARFSFCICVRLCRKIYMAGNARNELLFRPLNAGVLSGVLGIFTIRFLRYGYTQNSCTTSC